MSVDNEMGEEGTILVLKFKSPNLAKKKDNLFGRARRHVSDFPLDHPPLGHAVLAFMWQCGIGPVLSNNVLKQILTVSQFVSFNIRPQSEPVFYPNGGAELFHQVHYHPFGTGTPI